MLGNNFGSSSKGYNSGKNIWHEVKAAYPVGGTIVGYADMANGTVIPAGSMCILDQENHTITIVKASDTENLGEVNGLLYHDILVETGANIANANATGAVVFAGEIYIDRCEETIPSTVLAKLPMIVAIKEA